MTTQIERKVVASGLSKSFRSRSSFFGRARWFKAIDDISFEIGRGEVLGLVGESGSGKTTTGRILLGLEKVDSGKVYFDGADIFSLRGRQQRDFRRKAQLIFQDPFSTMTPHLKIGSIVSEPLRINHNGGTSEEMRRAVEEALESVSLVPASEFESKLPSELSGGQRQRVAIARALILKPEFIVADEPVSMLDVSVRVGILNLLRNLQKKENLTLLFITHDLAVASYVCDKIAVMKLGKIVESGDIREVMDAPKHEYTRALLDAVPEVELERRIGKT